MDINDIDMSEWKSCDILSDSLWLFANRAKDGKHKNVYHGNFIPQIPNQLLRRYTRENEVVLDAFLGSGTTLFECENLHRKCIGFDINESILQYVSENLDSKDSKNIESANANLDSKDLQNLDSIKLASLDSKGSHAKQNKNLKNRFYISKCDNTNALQVDLNMQSALQNLESKSVQFIIFHPPYMDIVKFSEEQNDLSHLKSLQDFIPAFLKTLQNTLKYLDKNRYFAVVIGDVYKDSEVKPLAFYALDSIKRHFKVKLKGIIVKDIQGNRGKLNTANIWRYRALRSDYYIFKHEYILFKGSVND